MLHASVTALLEALAAIEGQIARLDEQLKELARRSPVCWRRSTMRAPSRIWRKRVWRQSQLRSSATTIIPARCKSEFCQMTFEEALAQTMSIVGLLDVGGCRILDTDGFQALLGNSQRQRPIVIIAPRGSACPRPCVLLRL